ncbi:hypothetical protein [Streptomyces sp. NPDC020489]|uniref:hypothetical protein n=1 Tax=Streptomyces sp. NPDC020489 TaxID=3365077 RepID=UPI0037876EEF
MFEHMSEFATQPRKGVPRMTDHGAEPEGQGPDGEQEQPHEDQTLQQPGIEMEYVDHLPGGKVVMPVEREGSFTWLIVHGHLSPQARHEMLQDLRQIVGSGLWTQNWQPPQAGSD